MSLTNTKPLAITSSADYRTTNRATKTAAVMVTYHPDQLALSNIVLNGSQVPLLIVVDNTPGTVDFGELPANVRLLHQGENTGIAAALNTGVLEAAAEGCTHVILLDQDTSLPAGYAEQMVDFLAGLPHGDDVAFVAPNYVDRNTGAGARFAVLGRFRWRRVACGAEPFLPVTLAITSGSVMPISTFRRLGPFRVDFFIDEVDAEYCLRARHAGLRVLVNPGVTVSHAIGCRTKHRFLGVELHPKNHSPTRRYFIARNGTRMAIEQLFRLPAYSSLAITHILHEIFTVALYESAKRTKLVGLFRGIYDGLCNRLGPARTASERHIAITRSVASR